ncbi:PAX-interacting protein 1 isoform X2 [Bradysia coprophila]|uniref:PAX-interacting protein 1 isoform X2 n=1 Tax=Bradysia coprophila TaxID=38358 RepID=UPI00187DB98D|nr:PAX-interacting protein 1 isoform X2 [Bradysia coprophila]
MSAFAVNLDKLKLREDLFKEVKYFVTGNLDAKTDKLLKDGGASCCNYLMTNTTHLLCGEGFDESEIAQASDLYEIPSVTEAWVIASAKLGRLASTKPYDPTPNSKCFSQVFASITQVSATDRNRLYALITFNGGVVERNFTARTTHLICGSVDGPAYAKAITIKNDNFCVVTPDWIIDSLNGQELRDPQMYHPRLLIVPQPDSVSTKPAPKPTVVSMVPTSAGNSNPEKQSLSSILGFDYEENLEKSDIPVPREIDAVNAEKSAAASMTSQINSILQSVSASPSSSTLLTQQRPQLNQNMAMMQQRQTTLNQVEQQQPNKLPGQSPQQNRNSQAIATNASIQQQITAINQQHQYNQQQKLLAGNGTMQPQLNRSVSEIATSSSTVSSSATSGPDFLRQQSQQSHQILTQTKQPVQNVQNIMQQVGPTGQSQNLQQTVQMQQQISNPNQPQLIISQNNQVITQKHIINTSTAQGQQIIQQTRQTHLMSQQRQQTAAQTANILQSQQQSGLIIGTNQQKQQIQFIHTTQTPGGQQQVKIIQGQPQQHVMTGQHINKPLVQGQQPQQRIIISQQQFNQLNQQQQQLLNNSQNQNIVIINQQPAGQHPQIINSNNQQQANVLQQQVQGNNNLAQGPPSQQVANQQVMLQKNVANIQQSPQAPMQQQQQIDQQSPQHQNANSPQNQNQLNAQRMHPYLQQQQTIQQIKMQLQQVGSNASQQATMVTTQNQQQSNLPQLLQSPNIQSSIQSPIVQSTQQQQQQQQQIIQNQQVQSVPSPQQSQQQVMPTQQKIQIQNQIIVQQQQPGLVQPQNANILVNQWTPQSPVQQGQTNVGQPQQQFIRATQQRPQQWPPQAGNQPQRQLIHLDAATHAHLQTLDPIRRAEYLTKLQQKQRERSLMLRQQAFQGRPNAPNIVTGQRPAGAQHAIIVRSQMPAGMTQQQQLQWLQQVQQQSNVRQPLLVRGGAPGLSPISQTVSPQQQFVDPNAQQQLQQLQIQRQQQYQRLQQMQQQNRPQGQPVSPRGFTSEVNQVNQDLSSVVTTPTTPGAPNQIQIAQDPNSQASMNSKTKTALANMLSNRLSNNGSTPNIPESPTEPSAAGTLRLMTAQHNAALNQSTVQRTPQELAAIQQQQQQVQQQVVQRRTLGNITNSAPATPVVSQIQQPATPSAAVSHSPSSIKPPFLPTSPGRPPLQRPQFYGHNPNLKLPPALFLLGCTFFIVEYDEICEEMLPEWKELIQRHGGEIEQMYCPRVTHVLCRTQRHGVVMQAIRDSKRCVTAYWLNDTVMKKQVVPPWQALHLPMPSTFGTQRPATRHIIGISGFEGEERVRIKNMIDESGAMLTTYLSRHNTVLICKKPDGPKYKRAKDWNIPVVNTVWLSDILLGNLSGMSQFETAKYQQYNITGPFRIDYGLVPHLMTAWKSPINLTQESHERVKRHNSEPPAEPKVKKMRTIPPLEEIPDDIMCTEPLEADNAPKIIFSQVDNIDGLTRAVKSLGGEIVENPSDATHLVVTRLVRSCKLLVALSVVDHILSSKWIVESAKAGKFLPIDGYEINDPKFKQTFKADIQKTISSSSRRTLFEVRLSPTNSD